MKTIKKTIRGSVDFSKDDPTMQISIQDMFKVMKEYPIWDLFKKKQQEFPDMTYNEIMHEVILDCYLDMKHKNEKKD